jgi:DNA-binding response OmpR family regulator
LVKHILVVDDEPTIRNLVADALRDAGYDVDVAANGAEALRHMRRQRPDAIVLDLMMPHLDGSAFSQLMRLDPHHANVPILVLSAAYDVATEAARLGAQAVLTKPFSLEDLAAIVTRLAGPASDQSSVVNRHSGLKVPG